MKGQNKILESENFWLVIAWSLLSIINLIQLILYKFSVTTDYSWTWVIKYPTIAFVIGSLLIFFFITPGYKYLQKFTISKKVLLYILHGLIYGILYAFLIFLISGIWSGNYTNEWFLKSVTNFLLLDFDNVLKDYIFLMSILFAFNYFKSREHTIHSKNELERELIKVKHDALKAKLQPHFLFNTMNSIVALIDESTTKAQHALINLSDLLRYSMNIKPEKMIPISEEINLLKKYLSIEEARHENQLQIDWVSQKSDTPFEVPAMILQPIVENGIKHGFKKIAYKLHLIIEIDVLNKIILIKNNGNKLPESIKTGVGLQLVKQRLNRHFSNQYTFELYQDDLWIINKIIFS